MFHPEAWVLSVKEENCNVVMDDFMLATAADIVADPSAPDAFVDGIMEGKEWVWDNGILKESAVAEIKQEIDQATLINSARAQRFPRLRRF